MRIAIVGNIASGKSAVEKILLEKSFNVYDSDKIAHEILKNSEDVKKTFPDCYNDRKKLGELVFNDEKKRKLLESIVHPLVRQEIESLSGNLVFVSVPLLFEANMENLFDKIIFVSATTELRLERLMVRNNLTKEQALARINSQMPEEEKINKSDFIIYNNFNLEELQQQVEQMLDYLQLN